jgi:hypothetical protein
MTFTSPYLVTCHPEHSTGGSINRTTLTWGIEHLVYLAKYPIAASTLITYAKYMKCLFIGHDDDRKAMEAWATFLLDFYNKCAKILLITEFINSDDSFLYVHFYNEVCQTRILALVGPL